MISNVVLLIVHIGLYILRRLFKDLVIDSDEKSFGAILVKVFLQVIPFVTFGLITIGGLVECIRFLVYLSQFNQGAAVTNVVLHAISSLAFVVIYRDLLTTDMDKINAALQDLYSNTGDRSMDLEYFEIICIGVYVLKIIATRIN